MSQKYSQFRALSAITKASLVATFKSPQSVFFSLFFPVVLIVIFGSLSRGGMTSVDVAFEQNTDTTSLAYQALATMPILHVVDPEKRDVEDELRKGRLTAIIGVQEKQDSGSRYTIHLRTSSASQKDLPILRSVIKNLIHDMDQQLYPERQTFADISQSVVEGREYKMIDFFLPGMIGFSLIGSAIFGVSFLFYSLRETLVLKRLYSTPIKRIYII